MTLTINAQSILTVVALIGAIIALYTYFAKVVRFLDQQHNQDAELKAIKDEQCLLTFGVLACLKGLAEQGCDGPVHDAIDKIEKHINVEAHK